MTQEEYYSKFEDLENQIENLKNEYIKSLPFREGDFVRIKYEGKDIEAYISKVYISIVDGSGKLFDLLVIDETKYDGYNDIACVKIEDVEVIKQEK